MIRTQEESYAGSSCCAYGCFGSCCRCPSATQRERWCVSVRSKIPSISSLRMACDWSNCFEKLENGEIDIMGDISYTDERAEKMLYSDMPMGEEKYIWTACRCAAGIEN